MRHDLFQLPNGLRLHRHGGRIAGIYEKQGLDGRIAQLVDLRLGILPGMVPFLRQACSPDFHYIEIVARQMGNLHIRRKDRRHDGNFIPARKQAVLNQCVKYVAHGRRRAFHGKQVKRVAGRFRTAHFLQEIVVHNLFHMDKHAIRVWIIVPDNAVHQFVNPGVSVESFDRDPIIDDVPQQCHAPRISALLQIGGETPGNPLLFRFAGEIAFIPDAPALLYGKPSQGKEGFSRRRGDPVRVAPTCVKHGARGLLFLLLRQTDELVFEFKGADLLIGALHQTNLSVLTVQFHTAPFCIHTPMFPIDCPSVFIALGFAMRQRADGMAQRAIFIRSRRRTEAMLSTPYPY